MALASCTCFAYMPCVHTTAKVPRASCYAAAAAAASAAATAAAAAANRPRRPRRVADPCVPYMCACVMHPQRQSVIRQCGGASTLPSLGSVLFRHRSSGPAPRCRLDLTGYLVGLLLFRCCCVRMPSTYRSRQPPLCVPVGARCRL